MVYAISVEIGIGFKGIQVLQQGFVAKLILLLRGREKEKEGESIYEDARKD